MNRLARLCPDAVSFEYRSIDRLILNAYIPTLQTPGAMAHFLRQVRGKPILAGVVFKDLTDDFVGRIRAFAELHGLPIESPARGARPGELGQRMLDKAARRGTFGVVGIVVHQERARVFCSTHGGGRATNFRVKEDRRLVNHYYFYIRDPKFGEGFVRLCTYPPFATRIWFNGHGYLASHLAEQGIAVEFDGNCVVGCADPAALQKAADEFQTKVEQVARQWLGMVPNPLSEKERAAGYETRLSIFQAEFSDNLIFHKTAVLNRLYERVLSEHMHLGRPDMIKTMFDRRITRRTPGKFATRILREGAVACMKVFYKSSFLKQYNKAGRVLRTELCVNNPNDFGLKKGLAQLGQLSRIAEHTTTRFTEAQAVAHSTALDRSTFERLVTPSKKDEGENEANASKGNASQRVAALRFGTTWVMQLLMALSCAGLCFGAFGNRDVCRVLVEQLGVEEDQARPQRIGYELRKLRGKGLVHKAKGRNRYTLTPLGQKVVPALVKFQQRLLGPTLDSFDTAAQRLIQKQNPEADELPAGREKHNLDLLLHRLNDDMDALAAHCRFNAAA
jgi:hypothetical protein